MVLLINQTVGNYRVLKLLGEGGMGAVYLAEHPGIGRKAAVKVLHPSLVQNQEVVTRFFNEARAANAVRHQGIVEIFDFGSLPTGATYIIMEFLEGESLAARLRRVGRLRVGDAVGLAHQIADVLGAAHEQGIVHRDLKPDNLYLVPDSRTPGRDAIKVLDFGIAKLGGASTGSGSVKTRTGTIMGTPLYMSPEQCRGTKEVDHRTDIYALGVILYEMLCGRPPFVSEGHGELIHMHIGTPPPSPRGLNPGIPEAIERVVLKALAKDAGQRYQSMGEFQRALEQVPARTLAAPQVDPTAPTPREPRSDPPATTFSAAASMIEDAPAKPKRVKWIAVVGAIGAGGVAVALATGAFDVAPLPPSPSLRAASVTSPIPAGSLATAPQPPPAPAAKPESAPLRISISITSEPAGARVVRERDGADIGVTPFKESWQPGNGTEKLHLELAGYRSEPVIVPLDRGVDLTFGLRRNPPPPAHHKKAPAPTLVPTPAAAPAAPPKSPPKREPVPL